MNYNYEIRTIDTSVGNYTVIMRNDGAQIPEDEHNVDYQAFLEWVAAGNTPTPYNPEE